MLKEGDLALVINARVTENIGKVVTITKITTEEIIQLDEHKFFFNGNRSIIGVVEGNLYWNDFNHGIMLYHKGVFPINWLMPLTDPDQVIETTKELELTH